LTFSNVHFEIEKPGVSSLMAKQLARKVLAANKSLNPEDLNVDFGFFTAGKSKERGPMLVTDKKPPRT
jgi:hypothetical protein